MGALPRDVIYAAEAETGEAGRDDKREGPGEPIKRTLLSQTPSPGSLAVS
jgi:hypothetical protein